MFKIHENTYRTYSRRFSIWILVLLILHVCTSKCQCNSPFHFSGFRILMDLSGVRQTDPAIRWRGIWIYSPPDAQWHRCQVRGTLSNQKSGVGSPSIFRHFPHFPFSPTHGTPKINPNHLWLSLSIRFSPNMSWGNNRVMHKVKAK